MKKEPEVKKEPGLQPKTWLTLAEAAVYMGTSRKFIRSMIEDGLSFYQVRKLIFIRRSELDAYVEKFKIV